MGINAFAIAARKVQPGIPGQGRLYRQLVRSGQGSRRDARADRPGRRRHRPHTDGPVALQIAEERGIIGGFGQGADMSAFAPKAHLTAIIDIWGPHYIESAQAVLDGTWKAEQHLARHQGRRGRDRRRIIPKIPADVVAAAEAVKAGHHRRHAASLRRPDQGQYRRRARRGGRCHRRWRVLGRRLVCRRRRRLKHRRGRAQVRPFVVAPAPSPQAGEEAAASGPSSACGHRPEGRTRAHGRFRDLLGMAELCGAVDACDHGHRLDRLVVLFHRARPGAAARPRACRRWRMARSGRCMAAASTTSRNIWWRRSSCPST